MSSTPESPQPQSEWTARRIFDVLKTPVTLLALLAILAFGARYGYDQVSKPMPTPPPEPCQTVNGAQITAAQVTVAVENGGTKRGLAREVSRNLHGKGFVTSARNSDDRVTQTIIKGAKEDAPEVKLVAGFFKNAKVVADGRVDGTVTVMVGNDFGGMTMTAPTSIATGGNACLAATPTPTVPIPVATATP